MRIFYGEETEWLTRCAVGGRGRTEMCGYFDEENSVSLEMLDLYISGLVRQLNRLGCMTIMSCDGEGDGRPNIVFATVADMERAALLMAEVGLKHRVNTARKTLVILKEREEILGFASLLNGLSEKLNGISTKHLERVVFENVVEELLEIPGSSGHESIIRNHVMKKLAALTDKITVDDYGNILAEVTFGRASRETALTILLNSHLDVVDEIEVGREILKCGSVWTSSSGILGAERQSRSRRHSSYIETVATDGIPYSCKSRGLAFTVEEEVGLCGARAVSSEFLEDVQAAFVVDRRGRGDIVTGTYGIDFCDELVGAMLRAHRQFG